MNLGFTRQIRCMSLSCPSSQGLKFGICAVDWAGSHLEVSKQWVLCSYEKSASTSVFMWGDVAWFPLLICCMFPTIAKLIRPVPGALLAIIIPRPTVSFCLVPRGALASPHGDSTVPEGLTSETSPLIAISALQPHELCYGLDCSLLTAEGCCLIHYYAILELVCIVFRERKRCFLLKADLDPINSSPFSSMLHHVHHSHHSPHPSRPCLQGDPLVGAVSGLVAC